MKEQIKIPEKELNKMEISQLSKAEFKTLVIRTLKELCEDLNSIKKTHPETKDSLIEIKNNLQGKNNRVDEAKNQTNDLEHKEVKNNHTEQQEEKRTPQNENSANSLWDNFKKSNICLTGGSEGQEKEQETENLSKKMVKYNFLNLVKEIDMQVQEPQSPNHDGCKEAHSKTHHY